MEASILDTRSSHLGKFVGEQLRAAAKGIIIQLVGKAIGYLSYFIYFNGRLRGRGE